ncbi:MAG: flagellar hook-associated protein FlgL [Ideonella sp.]|jgi:flagellar hook-associated protein 3 FlgL|nr:flagellar hook-associated protein FlgL [Ideonella sp.]
MRIATATAYESAIENLQRRQRDMSEAQLQLTSGKRVNRASDDPTNAARAERSLAAVARVEATQRALEASRNAMQLTESSLGDAGDYLQRARELLVSAGNGSFSDGERQALAAELRGVREQLLATANRSDGAGGYLFGGQGSQEPPFVDTPAGVVFEGTAGRAQVVSGDALPIATDGAYTWMQSSSGTSVFTALDQAIADLSTPGLSSVDFTARNVVNLANVDASMNRVLAVRAEVGSMLNRLDSIEGRLADMRLANETERSAAEDLDLTRAISDFRNQQSGYDAALQSYAMVQRMSLFQYIGR